VPSLNPTTTSVRDSSTDDDLLCTVIAWDSPLHLWRGGTRCIGDGNLKVLVHLSQKDSKNSVQTRDNGRSRSSTSIHTHMMVQWYQSRQSLPPNPSQSHKSVVKVTRRRKSR